MIINQKRENDNNTSCLSKLKSFKKSHPFLFYGIIVVIIIIILIIILLCILLSKKEIKEDLPPSNNDIPEQIFPLPADSKSEVISIYDNIEDNDDGTLTEFCEYLSQNGLNLKDEQKVYLAYHWIVENIDYDILGELLRYEIDLDSLFSSKTTYCSGYTKLFKKLLLCMNYPESKIKIIEGCGRKGSPYEEREYYHEWNAVEINGRWCLIDTTWDTGTTDEFHLCLAPRCFIRKHLPLNDADQFLKNPISSEKFYHLLENVKEICKYNAEIIEDKIIQNICGKGKVIVNFLDGSTHNDYRYIMGSFEDYRFPVENLHVPSFVLNRTNKGFEIDFSVNEQGYSSISFGMLNESFGEMYFYCEEEPTEKFYYPIFLYAYYKSDLQLITPIQRYLTKGEKYNFEVKTNDFDELYVKVGGEVISMTKRGNLFKEDNIYIHNENVYISSNETILIQFSGFGDDIDYPICENRLNLKARLIKPLTGTLSKGHEYTFEIGCETEERIIIYCGEIFQVMEREGNIYKATINIETSTTATNLIIEYVKDIMVTTLYKYKVE